MNTLQQLQEWYRSQCDGEWEHGCGVSIGTLDNPGWTVRVDLEDTEFAGKPFTTIERMEHDSEWIRCWVEDQKFQGVGGPSMLDEILRTFLLWAK